MRSLPKDTNDDELEADAIPGKVFSPTTTQPDAIVVKRVGLWLVGLFAIALAIRFTNLAAKPAWMDEVATAIFCLGNYSRLMLSDQLMSLDQVNRALQLTPDATATDVVVNLLREDNHPPMYFVLTHWWVMACHWLTGQTAPGTYISLWAMRSLAAFLGALAVPVTYWLGWISFRDRLTALLCAALMAVSPFSVYLSQEARQYTLAILVVMASLGCFVLAVQAVLQRRAIRWLTVMAWVGLNAFGISVHYFCGITYFSEALVLLAILIYQCRQDQTVWRRACWVRIYVVAVGTAVGILVWLPILLHFYGSPQTTYITSSARDIGFWIVPIVQSYIGFLYALMGPITSGFTWQMVVLIVVTSVFSVLLYGPWLLWHLWRSLKQAWQKPRVQPGLLAMGGFLIAAHMTFLLICYGAGFDITRGHRYGFVFYPGILILAGAGLAPFLSGDSSPVPQSSASQSLTPQFSTPQPLMPRSVKIPFLRRSMNGRTFVATVLLLAFLGTQPIVFDASNLKFYLPTKFVDFMQLESRYPVILATESIVGDQPSILSTEIVSISWEIRQQEIEMAKISASSNDVENTGVEQLSSEWVSEPQFLLLERNVVTQNDPTVTLINILETVPQPFDFWMLGEPSPDLSAVGCSAPAQDNKGSFLHSHYVCEGGL